MTLEEPILVQHHTLKEPLAQQKVKLSEIALNKATVISKRGFLLKADSSNSGTIHIGTTNVSTTNGMVLEAGDSIFIDITNSDNIYLIGSGAGQGIFWMDM